MPYSTPFIKVNVEGHFGSSSANSVEQWSAGFHIAKIGGIVGGTTELTAFLTAIRGAVLGHHTSTATSAGTNCWIDGLSGAYIGTDGRYTGGSLQTTTRVPLVSSSPGIGTTTQPWTSAVVLSLRGSLLRGPASHGRMYWPATSIAITPATGIIPSATVSGILASAVTMLNSINTNASGVYGTGANVTLVSPLGLGFQSSVVRVGVGQRVDHMESRERKLTESHQFSNLTLAATILDDLDDEFRRRMQEENDERNRRSPAPS